MNLNKIAELQGADHARDTNTTSRAPKEGMLYKLIKLCFHAILGKLAVKDVGISSVADGVELTRHFFWIT